MMCNLISLSLTQRSNPPRVHMVENVIRRVAIFCLATFLRMAVAVVVSLATGVVVTNPFSVTFAQSTSDGDGCSTTDAVNLIRAQISSAKNFDSLSQRVQVMIRAAELLWPVDRDSARRTFQEAFDIATQNAHGSTAETVAKEGDEKVDQRYAVLAVLARHDSALARKLTDEMLHDRHSRIKEDSTRTVRENTLVSSRLLEVASALARDETNTALYFARISLRYPTSVGLPIFLYRLAEVNQSIADQFYVEALNSCRNRPMSEVLYLSAYPFGNGRAVGEVPIPTVYKTPTNFLPNRSLQRLFLETMLRRARQSIQSPPEVPSNSGVTDAYQIWLALTQLDSQIQAATPDLAQNLQQTRESLYPLLPQSSRLRAERSMQRGEVSAAKNFAERVESARNEGDPNVRDRLLVSAVLASAHTQSLDDLITASEKITDLDVQQQLLDWLYFVRAQSAIKAGNLEDAKKLISKVNALDQRAYLFSEIARESLDSIETQAQARLILDEGAAEARKAPNTIVKARTLLAFTYLYIKFDVFRSIEELSRAIDCINHLDAPDFSNEVMIRKIQGKSFGAYATYQTPGFRPENVVRDVAKVDLTGALYQVVTLTDKSLRALTTLSITQVCLERTQKGRKSPKSRRENAN